MDKKYLDGQTVFQLNVLQEGEAITVDFDAVYNDGHGCAPQGNGPGKIVDENTLPFTFTDTANNAGTGTIKRLGDGVIISIKPTRVADPRCTVFLQGRHPAKAGALAPMWEGPGATPSGGNGRPAPAGAR
jgi:hypothetical protein